LVDAFIHLRRTLGAGDVQLRSAGWLGDGDRAYFDEQLAKLRAAGLADAYSYGGVVDRPGKIEFLSGLDVLSVPTTYREPKGLYVLEALAAGVPVVLPEHGAFPELLAATGGGRLFPPGDVTRLAETIHALLEDRAGRSKLAEEGRRRVHEEFNAARMAQAAMQMFERFLPTQ
jgi:glycosyltransferase involved in cell wall biosynthesis